ncbi:putative 3'(2'),5'-bisphosphate nucleotidase, mitochondrial isoform X2 [Nicotiana sylvestris]|uniref:PAP-specific phosphatase, mitochondrial isoform X2 n=1 Tax=Nicotiana sylvestris TaxID=4096 RepID=A0A1U7V8I1_NICSY|nr:PREDICTED: putative PAP-specific phosphatase, mitochondrial isoform X2 [Nicotiana sylvestris]
MDLLRYSASRFPAAHPQYPFHTPLRRRFVAVRSSLSLPFPEQKAKYYRELEAAVDVVERACRLCVDVKKSLFSSNGRILEKIDQTPVTIADFGVQALVSLEMNRLFPSIPLVAEEDSAFLRSNNLVGSVVDVVKDKATSGYEVTDDNILKAIDRGGKDACVFGPKPATYWILDPIDGTRGFVKGSEALYVVGLALVVEGQIVLGVMGCPNWCEDCSENSIVGVQESSSSRSGIIMVSHLGCGTWTKRLSDILTTESSHTWTGCSVDSCQMVEGARFTIPESQSWKSLPLSVLFDAKRDSENIGKGKILLLSACCGSLCKYLMVASGRASVYIQGRKATSIIKVWDHAVGIICVHEAGGKVTDWAGGSLDIAADQTERRLIFPSGGVLVTNGSLHSKIIGMISSNSSVL